MFRVYAIICHLLICVLLCFAVLYCVFYHCILRIDVLIYSTPQLQECLINLLTYLLTVTNIANLNKCLLNKLCSIDPECVGGIPDEFVVLSN